MSFDSTDTRAYTDERGAGNAVQLTAGGRVSITASADLQATMIAGAVGVGAGSAGVGVSNTTLIRTSDVLAAVGFGAAVSGSGVLVRATQGLDLDSIAIGGAGGSSAGVAGSVTINVVTHHTRASLDAATVDGTSAADAVAVAADDTSDIVAVAGAVAFGGTAGVGAGVDVEVLNKTTEAWIGARTAVTAKGNVTVDAMSREDLTSISVGAGFGGSAAVTVNAGVSVVNVTTRAFVAGGAAGQAATVTADGSVRVAADDAMDLDVIAGNFAGAGGAGVGAAAAVPVVTKTTEEFVGDHVTVNARGLTGLDARTGDYAVTLVDTRFSPDDALSGGTTFELGYAHGFAEDQEVLYDNGGGDNIGGLTGGQLYYVHLVPGSSTKVQLKAARGGPTLGDLTVPANGGDSQRFVRTDQAGVRQDRSPRFNPAKRVGGNNLDITLPYALDVNTGDPVVYSSGGGNPIGGLTDGATYYVIRNGGSIRLAASKEDADANRPLTLNRDAATGRSHSLVKQGETPAGDAALLGLRTAAPGVSSGFRGVAVTATSSTDLAGVGISAALGGSVGVGVTGSVQVVSSRTAAFVGKSARVNTATAGADAAQSVLVAAGDVFYQLLTSASLALGGAAGVGAGVGVGVVSLNCDALIDSSAIVSAAGDVVVQANGRSTVVSVVFSGGGGTVGVAGAVSVIDLETHVDAGTGANVTINAGNNVLIAARNDTDVSVVSGGAAGGFVGVGAGIAVTTITKGTRAFVGAGSTVDARATGGAGLGGIYNGTVGGGGFGASNGFQGLAVQATSTEDVFGLAIAAAGGFVGVAGGIGFALVQATTLASIGENARVNTLAGAGASQSVNVSAVNRVKTRTVGGGAAGGFVGVAGGIDIGKIESTTKAWLGSGSDVRARDSVEINALAIKDVRTYAISVGGGFVGAAGSVSVWTLGMPAGSSYADGSVDRGAWAQGTDYEKGDIVTAADGKRYTAKADLGTSSGNPSGGARADQWAPEKDALQTEGGNAGADAGSQASGGGNGYRKVLSGTSSGSGNKADSRIRETTGADSGSGVSRRISDSAPDSNLVGNALGNTALPEGTVAAVNTGAAVTAGHDVRVRADEYIEFVGVAGTATGGFVAVGGTILVANVRGHADASIQAGAVIQAGPGLGDDVVVSANTTEYTTGLAFAGAAGLVAVGGQVTVLNSMSNQRAQMDNGALVTQAGSVDVGAHANRNVYAQAAGGALAGAAAGVVIADATVGGETAAYLGAVAVGQTAGRTVGNLHVWADPTVTAQAYALGLQFGFGLALGGTIATAEVHPTVRAAVGPGANVRVTQDVLVEAAPRTKAQAEAYGVAVGGGLSLGITVADAEAAPTVAARVEGGSVSAGRDVIVRSWHNFTANGPTGDTGAVAKVKAGSGGTLAGTGAFADADASAQLSTELVNTTTTVDRSSSAAARPAPPTRTCSACRWA